MVCRINFANLSCALFPSRLYISRLHSTNASRIGTSIIYWWSLRLCIEHATTYYVCLSFYLCQLKLMDTYSTWIEPQVVITSIVRQGDQRRHLRQTVYYVSVVITSLLKISPSFCCPYFAIYGIEFGLQINSTYREIKTINYRTCQTIAIKRRLEVSELGLFQGVLSKGLRRNQNNYGNSYSQRYNECIYV